MDSVEEWEGAALSLLRETGLEDPPQDARELAHCLGLDLEPRRGTRRSGVDGDVLWYPAGARPVRQQGLIAHEIGHLALAWAGLEQSEKAADYVAAALMLPWGAFDRDIREASWDLLELQRRHPNCSLEMIGRRVTELRLAVCTVVDNGRQKLRVGSPGLRVSRRPNARESYRLAKCLATGEVQRHGADGAYPAFSGPWRRVVGIGDLDGGDSA